jgi:hypothetical protein
MKATLKRDSMATKLKQFGSLCAMLITLNSCGVGKHHIADATLENNFLHHEVEFRQFVTLVSEDPSLQMLSATEFRYRGRTIPVTAEAELLRTGIDRQRWRTYQMGLRRLGLMQVTKRDRAVVFKVDQESISNGSSEKGYWYDDRPPGRELAGLDTYRILDSDHSRFGGYLVSKHLKGNWYIYLSID